jgi:hypothetical protein
MSTLRNNITSRVTLFPSAADPNEYDERKQETMAEQFIDTVTGNTGVMGKPSNVAKKPAFKGLKVRSILNKIQDNDAPKFLKRDIYALTEGKVLKRNIGKGKRSKKQRKSVRKLRRKTASRKK